MTIKLFKDTVKEGDKCSVVGNPYIPDHKDAQILTIDRENGVARVQYTLKGEVKSRNVELSQICPPFSHLADGLANCLVALVKAS